MVIPRNCSGNNIYLGWIWSLWISLFPENCATVHTMYLLKVQAWIAFKYEKNLDNFMFCSTFENFLAWNHDGNKLFPTNNNVGENRTFILTKICVIRFLKQSLTLSKCTFILKISLHENALCIVLFYCTFMI